MFFRGAVSPFFEDTTMLIITKKTEPEDIEFMHKCHEVDMHKPATWKKYPVDINGANGIIKMEYEELLNAKSMEDWEENLYHLSVALLHAWRIYKHKI